MNYQLRTYPVLLFLLCLLSSIDLGGQNNQSNQSNQDPIVIDLNQIENDGKRVEVQRYIGYENLFFRYLTLPYDVSLNTSNQGRYFDIGFMLIILVPLALLLLVYKTKKLFYVALSTFLLYLCLSLSYSYIKFEKNGPVMTSDQNWSSITSQGNKEPSESVLLAVYDVALTVSFPIRALINKISGETDHVTYPILFILFGTLLFLVYKRFGDNRKALFILLVLIVYFFLWLLLSGGIIWYGFLLLPLLYAASLKVLSHEKAEVDVPFTLVKPLILAVACVWMILAYAARIGNIDYFTAPENMGKDIVDNKLVYYSAGLHTEKESQNVVYNNIGDTFDQINANDGLIYQVGTSVTFNIRNNPVRIFQDNILITFFDILNKYREPDIIMDVLKASGFRYIIIDLYTPTLDKTPEKSLTKKYQLFLNTIYESRDIKLLATDRIIQVARENGQIENIKNVFVTNYNPKDEVKIQNHGSYAIYEIH